MELTVIPKRKDAYQTIAVQTVPPRSGAGRLAGGGGGQRLAVGALVARSAEAAIGEALFARVRFHAPPAVLTGGRVVLAVRRI